jgi:HD-like signal output (HDOD) protein
MHGRALWEHALGVALAARELALMVPDVDPEDAFVAGLLHDMGKVVFDLRLSQAFLESVGFAQANPDICTLEAERQFLGWNHCEAGGLVAEAWNLPEPIREVITCHHELEQPVHHRNLVLVVATADWLCHSLGIGPFRRPVNGAEECRPWAELGQDPEDLARLAEEFLPRLHQDKRALGLS